MQRQVTLGGERPHAVAEQDHRYARHLRAHRACHGREVGHDRIEAAGPEVAEHAGAAGGVAVPAMIAGPNLDAGGHE